MRLFRREEPLHVRLAREAGVDLNGAPLEVAATPGEERRAVVRAVPERDPDPAHERTSFHPPPPWRGGYGGGAVGLPKLPEWDAVASVGLPESPL